MQRDEYHNYTKQYVNVNNELKISDKLNLYLSTWLTWVNSNKLLQNYGKLNIYWFRYTYI